MSRSISRIAAQESRPLRARRRCAQLWLFHPVSLNRAPLGAKLVTVSHLKALNICMDNIYHSCAHLRRACSGLDSCATTWLVLCAMPPNIVPDTNILKKREPTSLLFRRFLRTLHSDCGKGPEPCMFRGLPKGRDSGETASCRGVFDGSRLQIWFSLSPCGIALLVCPPAHRPRVF